MTTTKANLLPLIITAGVQPPTDKTPLATPHYTAASGIRFRYGFPEKIGGWISIALNFATAYGVSLVGIVRTIFSTILTTAVDTFLGTNYGVYVLEGGSIENITPLSTSTIAAANSIDTQDAYISLVNNPFTTTLGSGIVIISTALSSEFIPGDSITISGALTTNGIANTILNATHSIHAYGGSGFTIITSGTATSTGTGGGNSVIMASGLIGVTVTNTLSYGDRIKLLNATAFEGITALEINQEFIVRAAGSSAFIVMTSGTATGSGTGGGGAATTVQFQIPVGPSDVGQGFGYGAGLYGVGLYGTALPSQTTGSYPQIWFMDRFGIDVIMTPGNQQGLYVWTGSTTTAPTLVTNAPTMINYAFVSDNIVVTFGAGGVPNNITTSDQSNLTVWTSSSTNQVFIYNVNGASALISHVPIAGVNLIFTAHQTYEFQYIGLPLIWSIGLLENNVGIIGPMARVAVGGAAYWMDTNGFWMWSGGNVQPIPSNTQEYSTLLHYVFQNINTAQSYKSFAWYNEEFQEIWFHYPSAVSNECDSIARYHIVDQTWVPDMMDRTAAEYPNLSIGVPRLASSEGILFQHETGMDDDTNPLPFSLTSNLRGGSNIMQREYGLPPTENSLVTGFVPDSEQTGNINVEIQAKRFPQSQTLMYDENFTVTPTTELVSTTIGGRFWDYTISGNELGQTWRAGQWMEYSQPSSKQ